MPPKRKPPPQLYGPLGPNGEIQYPPLKSYEERERERLEALEKEMKRKRMPKGDHFKFHITLPSHHAELFVLRISIGIGVYLTT